MKNQKTIHQLVVEHFNITIPQTTPTYIPLSKDFGIRFIYQKQSHDEGEILTIRTVTGMEDAVKTLAVITHSFEKKLPQNKLRLHITTANTLGIYEKGYPVFKILNPSKDYLSTLKIIRYRIKRAHAHKMSDASKKNAPLQKGAFLYFRKSYSDCLRKTIPNSSNCL
ncbi:MAG: hypothetical protein LRY41_02400 [Candidatus Pacebacteria bacterium]|nr:hypothetical protein [Candidatus Paceibacterota bacterium]